MPIPHVRAALDGLASYRPTDGVHGPHRLRPLSLLIRLLGEIRLTAFLIEPVPGTEWRRGRKSGK